MINRVVLMGRMVADPELKVTNGGVSVVSFRIAVDRNYVKNGEHDSVSGLNSENNIKHDEIKEEKK